MAVETRHFLAMMYRFLSSAMSEAPLKEWQWHIWLEVYGKFLVSAVSFNYDVLLEKTFTSVGRKYDRRYGAPFPEFVHVSKPHGSCDFDIQGFDQSKCYPVKVVASMNNTPLRIVPAEEWLLPPAEPLIALPYEKDPYAFAQWALPGFHRFKQLGAHLTHCIFVGLSYHTADRWEIDALLNATNEKTEIIVADPNPSKEFLATIKKSGRPLKLWTDGPDRLP